MAGSRKSISKILEDLARPVGRTIVDDENFACDGQIDGAQSIDDGENGSNLVVNGNDDREKFRAGIHLRLGAGVRFGGAGLYSSITLLMMATG